MSERKKPSKGKKPAAPAKRKPRKGSVARTVADAEGKPPTSPVAPSAVEVFGDAEDPGGWDDEGLTFKQRLFVAAYAGPAAGNATRAAQMAGFADSNYNTLKQRASDLVRQANVQRAVQRALVARQGGPEWTRAGVVEIANGNMGAMLKRDADGRLAMDPEAIEAAAAWGLVKKFEVDRVETPDGGFVSVKYRLQLYDRLTALQTLAKMHGMLVDQQQVTVRQVDPQQQAMGKILRDPQAFALARQMTRRLNETAKPDEGSDDERGRSVDRN